MSVSRVGQGRWSVWAVRDGHASSSLRQKSGRLNACPTRPSRSLRLSGGAGGFACVRPVRRVALQARAVPALLLLILCSACGYHTSAHGDLMPKSIQTIAIQPFRNQTTRYQLARMLPEDLTREFIARTHYRIVSDPNMADAVLSGVLVTFAAYSTVTDPTTGRATAAQAIATLRLTLTERATGKVLFTRPSFEVRERYEVSIDPAQYFDESETAMQRLSRSVAQATVSAILENF
jgi:RNase P/RNase MRP subunit p29